MLPVWMVVHEGGGGMRNEGGWVFESGDTRYVPLNMIHVVFAVDGFTWKQ